MEYYTVSIFLSIIEGRREDHGTGVREGGRERYNDRNGRNNNGDRDRDRDRNGERQKFWDKRVQSRDFQKPVDRRGMIFPTETEILIEETINHRTEWKIEETIDHRTEWKIEEAIRNLSIEAQTQGEQQPPVSGWKKISKDEELQENEDELEGFEENEDEENIEDLAEDEDDLVEDDDGEDFEKEGTTQKIQGKPLDKKFWDLKRNISEDEINKMLALRKQVL